MIDFSYYKAAIFRSTKKSLHPVEEVDSPSLENLYGLTQQKEELYANTFSFMQEKECNHALLWGARGCGKSTLVKAVCGEFLDHGLRIIEFGKDELIYIPETIDILRKLPFKFIFFCDDISFEQGDYSYKGLKSLLEGSIEKPPRNILVYATSNRRHFIREEQHDNLHTRVGDNGELHHGDTLEEKLSLSDRFGLWLSFYPFGVNEYLHYVESLFETLPLNTDLLRQEARIYGSSRGNFSPRTARQFYCYAKTLHLGEH